MPEPIVGLHHVTAIASDPQRNLDFYTELLGLRLVKRTVNFDDPGTYHFYFGDDAGSPGTLLTFFAWPHASRGNCGIGETSATAFSVAHESLDYWEKRLLSAGIPVEKSAERFGKRVLAFADPDGMKLEVIGDTVGDPAKPVRQSEVPAEHGIHGFSGVTLCEGGFDLSAQVLEKMGYAQSESDGNRYRFTSTATTAATGDGLASYIDVLVQTQLTYGRMGSGSVHHIAFRVTDDAEQLAWREALKELKLNITPVLDRTYFHSIYFREPGGVLFEIATDVPGFATDESADTLGEALKLPAWLESRRSVIENLVPPITLHYQKAL
jgi:glyoxalase family protein